MLMKMSMTAIAAVITSTSKDKDKNYRYKRGRAEKLTSKQIKRAAASQLRQNFEGISMAVLNQFALITFMLLIEALIYITSELSDVDYRPLELSYYRESRVRIFTMCGRMLGYLFLNSVLVYIQRRRFINTGEDGGVVERYIAMHPKRIMLPGAFDTVVSLQDTGALADLGRHIRCAAFQQQRGREQHQLIRHGLLHAFDRFFDSMAGGMHTLFHVAFAGAVYQPAQSAREFF